MSAGGRSRHRALRPNKDAASAAQRQNGGLQPNNSAAATRSVSAEESSSGVEWELILSAGREQAARNDAARSRYDAALPGSFASFT